MDETTINSPDHAEHIAVLIDGCGCFLSWRGSGRSITRIALDLGYASTAAFSYIFRQETAATPGDGSRRETALSSPRANTRLALWPDL